MTTVVAVFLVLALIPDLAGEDAGQRVGGGSSAQMLGPASLQSGTFPVPQGYSSPWVGRCGFYGDFVFSPHLWAFRRSPSIFFGVLSNYPSSGFWWAGETAPEPEGPPPVPFPARPGESQPTGHEIALP